MANGAASQPGAPSSRVAALRESAKNKTEGLGICICFSFSIFALLLVILLPLSFKTVEYYQYGILRRASTGKVLLRRGIFGPGTRKMVGPDYNFKKFQADAHIATFNKLSVFSADRLVCFLDLDVVYFINRTQLVQLHNTYERQYRPVVESRMVDAIKNTAPKYSTTKLYTARGEVSDALYAAIKDRLKEVFMVVDALYLHLVTIPEDVTARQLRTAVQLETNIMQRYNANATQIRQETLKTVNTINNNATLVQQNAESQATIIRARADVEARKTVESAQEAGLEYMFDALNVTAADHKASLDYIRTLRTSYIPSINMGYSTKISTFDGPAPAPAG